MESTLSMHIAHYDANVEFYLVHITSVHHISQLVDDIGISDAMGLALTAMAEALRQSYVPHLWKVLHYLGFHKHELSPTTVLGVTVYPHDLSNTLQQVKKCNWIHEDSIKNRDKKKR